MSDNTSNAVVKQIIPLPATVEEMVAKRTMPDKRTLNDYVDDIHKALWAEPNEVYQKLLDAVYDEDAVEGSLAIDNAKAAEIIRDWAIQSDRVPYVASKKLATIVKALNVVLRRYKMTRRERASTIDGKVVNGE